jgi:hypothetical protein
MVKKIGIVIASVVIAGAILATYLPQLVSQMAFAAPETVSLELIVDPKTIKLSDLNNNTAPDSGEMVGILGKLYTPGTENEVGTFRGTFMWGGWANSTEGIPVDIGTQVYDIKGNGTIVVVGDEPGGGEGVIGKPVEGVIAGGTGSYKTITSGVASLTHTRHGQLPVPFDVTLEFERSSSTTNPAPSSS